MAAKAAIPLLFLTLFFIAVGNLTLVKGQGQQPQGYWCVPKASAGETLLNSNINYACLQPNVNCQAISLGGPCFYPNTTINHASVAMNLYYQAYKVGGIDPPKCFFANSGLISITDPSYDDCKYPFN